MKRAELIAEIKKPGKVFAFVRLTKDDGFYIAVEKASLLASVLDDTVEYNAHRREDGLYID